MKKAVILTYGCQMNKHDSEVIAGLLQRSGFSLFTELIDNPDILILNTCAVRQNAENRILGRVGELKSYKDANPDLLIGICGCVAQEHGEKLLDKIKHLDFVVGPADIFRIDEIIFELLSEKKKIAAVSGCKETLTNATPHTRFNDTQAWISIISGCDNFCSYCIVPYVRGREKSRTAEDIETEIKKILSENYKEINLLGQNVNSYGNDTGGNISFPELLRRICAIPQDFWLRFVTSHPKDLSDELINVMTENQKICRHLNLPAQSGSTRILEKMNRKYSRGHYLDIAEKLKKSMPDIALTTDLIIGFPGERDSDFEDTLNLMREVKFSSSFIFKYSRRSGTAASKFKDELPQKIIEERHKIALDLQIEISAEFNKNYIGRKVKTLVENISPKDKNFLSGRTEHNKIVIFQGSENLIGNFCDILIENSKSWTLFGKII